MRCERCNRAPNALREIIRSDGEWVCEECLWDEDPRKGEERAEDAIDLLAKGE